MTDSTDKDRRTGLQWPLRVAIGAVIAVACVVGWYTHVLMTERLTESLRARAEVRLAAYSGNIISELNRTSIVPQLLARDPALIGALGSQDYTQSSQRLIEVANEIAITGMKLLDGDGRVVAATDRAKIGEVHRGDPYFVEALRANGTVFTVNQTEAGGSVFTYSRKVEAQGSTMGVIVVEADLARFEQSWAGFTDAVAVMDSTGRIILSTESRWRGRAEEEALAIRSAPSAIQRAIRVTDWGALPSDAYLRGEDVLRQEARLNFQGWKIASFTTYAGVRERVNAVLAIEIMLFALILAGLFWLSSRRAFSSLDVFRRESAELRALNDALQREIAERERAERNLEVAEQTIQQSSKLALLGEMSAAVSHELNQPLAAMKTYLAGAKLLLQRRRPDEALSSFQRIDDLIERMGAITKQLKSYARKGGTAVEPLDVRVSVSAALSMMEPQLRARRMHIETALPREPIMVEADRIRLEQVLVNLLRNALDATKGTTDPQIRIILSSGDEARITVRDNGSGIADLDNLFEPFYTTKAPGDGTGLGLAISSGIVSDLGGRLTARNGSSGGAVFEITLPLYRERREAAE
jgi:two-component system C4-dicarboxylate transport sensor histidine kinase DctB